MVMKMNEKYRLKRFFTAMDASPLTPKWGTQRTQRENSLESNPRALCVKSLRTLRLSFLTFKTALQYGNGVGEMGKMMRNGKN